jgi:hypothetical protein
VRHGIDREIFVKKALNHIKTRSLDPEIFGD